MNQTAQSWWFIFYKDQLLLEKKEDGNEHRAGNRKDET